MPKISLKDKIKSINNLKEIIPRLKCSGKKIVFTNGCFDILHYGHVKYLEDARNIGDILIVAINSDASVKRLKGKKRPMMNQGDRSKVIAALESVDYVTIFNEDTPLKTIKLIKPDILVKGSDWKGNIVGSDFVAGYGGKVNSVNLIKGRSTSNLIQKIAKNF